MLKLVVVSVFWLAVIQIEKCQADNMADACSCIVPYERIGCFKDVKSDRALPTYLMNDRDPSHPNWSHQMIQWRNWNNYLPEFICRCAEKAKREGYKYFGVQFFGECWVGDENVDYDRHGPATKCFDTQFKSCTKNDKHCAGGLNVNMVYKLPDPTCDMKYERVGCFRDKKSDRTLPLQPITDRDSKNKAWSGQFINWANYDLYMPDLVCRCAKKAKSMGHDVFALQYWGECWTGVASGLDYYSHGPSKKCFNKCFQRCKNFDRECTGAGFANFVFRTGTVNDAGVITDSCPANFEYRHCHLGLGSLTVELVNEVDPTSPKFDGHVHEYEDWDKRFKELLCSCSMAANEKNMKWFGVTAEGICYGGSTVVFNNNGQCEEPEDKTCDPGDLCGGRKGANSLAIYEVV